VVARGAGKLALRRLRLQPVADECAPGWRYAYGSGMPRDLAALVVRAAGAGDGLAVGAVVHDRDYGQVVAVGSGRMAALAIRPELAGQPLPHDPEAFAHWSWSTPRPLSAEEAQRILERAGVPAEDTAEELFDQLGLPAPYDPLTRRGTPEHGPAAIGTAPEPADRPTRESIDATGLGGYLAPLGFMQDATPIAGRRAGWRELRYVPGLGQGFLGIWDRESPYEPAATFVVSRRGEARLREELERLQGRARAGPSGVCYDRFDWVDASASIAGKRLLAAVFDDDQVVGVVVAAEHGHEGEPAAYLVRPGDGVRHVYSVGSLEALTNMLERYLGDAELSEWITLPADAPPDLGSLAPVVLALAGL